MTVQQANTDQTESGNYGVSQMESGLWYFHPTDHQWFAFNANDSFSVGFASKEEAIEAAQVWEQEND